LFEKCAKVANNSSYSLPFCKHYYTILREASFSKSEKEGSFGIHFCFYLIGNFQNFLEQIYNPVSLGIEAGLKLYLICT